MTEGEGDRGYLAIASRAARAAGELLHDVRVEQIRSKSSPRDLVTEWDVRAEAVIRDVLAETGLPILGEEGGQTGSGDSATRGRWLVDPIDGTVNFSHGLPLWSIAIALEQAGAITVGVVYAPALGWWFEATAGGGARAQGTSAVRDETIALQVSTCRELEHAMLATGFPYDLTPPDNFAEWEHFYRRAGTCRRLGCASLDLCLVARGWLDGYWERRLSPWDLAAGALIVVEAGGSVTNPHGGPFDPHSGEAVASNGAIHSVLISELARVRP